MSHLTRRLAHQRSNLKHFLSFEQPRCEAGRRDASQLAIRQCIGAGSLIRLDARSFVHLDVVPLEDISKTRASMPFSPRPILFVLRIPDENSRKAPAGRFRLPNKPKTTLFVRIRSSQRRDVPPMLRMTLLGNIGSSGEFSNLMMKENI
jgi:hypothetical protein